MPTDKDILDKLNQIADNLKLTVGEVDRLRRSLEEQAAAEPEKPTNPWEGWVWPMRVYDNGLVKYDPTISDGFKPFKTDRSRQHLGVDLCYKRLQAGEPNLPTASKWFFCPPDLPVAACGPGTIWSAGISERGHWVVIDHGETPAGKLTSFYTHMESFSTWVGDFHFDLQEWKKNGRRLRRPTREVLPGSVLGICGDDPSNAHDIRHLHFELKVWTALGVGKQIDPGPLLKQWKVLD
jgi:hypothetical protein